MIKGSVLLIASVLFTANCFSQLLEGEWKGYFTMGDLEFTKTEIWISFHKINDTTFEAYTKTVSKNDTAIYILTGGFLKKNILYLEETRMIKEFSTTKGGGCKQVFKLYYREKKKDLTLNGEWFSDENKCSGSGNITLKKQL